VLPYEQADTDRGGALKTTEGIASFEADAKHGLSALARNSAGNRRLATMGVCLGGQLAYRAALDPSTPPTLSIQHQSARFCIIPPRFASCAIHQARLDFRACFQNRVRRIGPLFTAHYATNILAFAENNGHDLRKRCGE
jgi:hypothetical protein